MNYLGDFAAGASLQVWWNTHAVAGESITRATDGSIRIYKDTSNTYRSSSSGITDSEDVNSLTGVHRLNIDLSDNSDAGFYAAGHNYAVVLVAATIDGKTINHVLAQFSIANRPVQSLATAAVASIWDTLTTALTTTGSIGAFLISKLTAFGSLVTFSGPLNRETRVLALTRGDSYYSADGREISVPVTGWPDFTGGTVTFNLGYKDGGVIITKTGSFTADGDVQTLVASGITSTETGVLSGGSGNYVWEFQITLANGHIVTPVGGTVSVERDVV